MFKHSFYSLWEALVFFFFASAAGGAMIPTLICKKLEKMGEDYKFSPVSLLRLIMKAEKEVVSQGGHAPYNPPTEISFEWSGYATRLGFMGTQGDDGISTFITLDWYHESRMFVVTIEGREKSVEARKQCGFEKKTYEQLPQGFWK